MKKQILQGCVVLQVRRLRPGRLVRGFFFLVSFCAFCARFRFFVFVPLVFALREVIFSVLNARVGRREFERARGSNRNCEKI